jgi:hypothetical protein
MSKEQILKILEVVYQEVSQTIVACNIQGADKENRFYKPLVFAAQKECDKILENNKYSVFERVLLCSIKVKEYTAGNCMLQAFVIFTEVLQKLINAKLITLQSCISIFIGITENHTYIRVDDFVCDPWKKYLGVFKGSVYETYETNLYFGVDADWNCWNDNQFDEFSTAFTYSLFKETPAPNKFFQPRVCELNDITNLSNKPVSGKGV